MDGPQTAEVKFVKGFCRVFADNIAYDCELAMRSSKHDSDADSFVLHAAEIAKEFDVKLRGGALFDSTEASQARRHRSSRRPCRCLVKTLCSSRRGRAQNCG